MMHYYYNDFYPSSMWGFGSFFNIIFWLVVIYILVMVFKNRGKYEEKSEDPMTIIKTRYAKGEITKEQFELMKKELH